MAGLDGIRASGVVIGTTARLAGSELTILGVSDEAAATLAAVPAELADNQVIVPSYLLSSGLSVGDRITVRTPSRSAEFTVAAGALAGQGVNGDSLITTAAAVEQLAPGAQTLAVWAAVDTAADLEEVTAGVNRLIAAEPDLAVGGAAPERAVVGAESGHHHHLGHRTTRRRRDHRDRWDR